MKIAFCSSEVVPFAKTGGLADVCGTLPLALEKLEQDVVIFLPAYGAIDAKKFGVQKGKDGVSRAVIGDNIAVYLIEHAGFFHRDGLYGNAAGDYPDNLERFDFFCRRTLEVIKDLNLHVDIVHCHDWQSALIPVYLKEHLRRDPFFPKMKTVLSLHNLAYQGLFPGEEFKKLSLDASLYRTIFEFYGKVNLLKAGIMESDAVATVSPQYAREIQTEEYGCGLEGALLSRKDSLIGILNGLDYETWNPATDRYIEYNYSPAHCSPKAANKTVLQKKHKLPVRHDIPLFGFVGRLSHQKGIDLIVSVMEDVLALDLQVVFLGVGEEKYQSLLLEWASRYPKQIAVDLQFSEQMAHHVYAGADIFLMPSIYEPCGLSQMISLRYGTIPLVYRTGGLADTVTPFDQGGNGFVFSEYRGPAYLSAVKQAVSVYRDKERFQKMMAGAFKANFSWEDSARQYVGLYNQCLS